MSVSISAASVTVGQSGIVVATARDATGAALSDRVISWSSSNPNVATVDATGRFSAIAVGVSDIIAASEGKSASVALSVLPVPVATVLVSLDATTMFIGARTRATATLRDGANAALTGRAIAWSSSNPLIASIDSVGVVTAVAAGSALITATSEGKIGSATVTVLRVPVASVSVSLPSASVTVRSLLKAQAGALDSAGAALTGRAITYRSSDTLVAQVDSTGSVIAIRAGTADIIASSEGKSGQATLTVAPASLVLKGIYTQFDRRGWPSGIWSGDAIRDFGDFDSVLRQTVEGEISDQLDVMRSLGANAITFELRSSDSTTIIGSSGPPRCNVNPSLGLLWPQPTQKELTNLSRFFDLVQRKQMKVLLRLVNTRMESRAEATSWLGSILRQVKGHPALELVLFEGDERLVDQNGDGVAESCGGQAEPSLWYGPNNAAANYVEFAIRYAMSLGYPARQLSAQAIAGSWNVDAEPGNRFATEGHMWSPIRTLKAVFDRIGIPDQERTYALSLYEQRKCRSAGAISCPADVDPDTWADQTVAQIFRTIGARSRARVIAVELGVQQPIQNGWTSALALESAVGIMRRRGMEGGSFWRWVHYSADEEATPGLDEPIKRRGPGFNLFPTADVLRRLFQSP